MPFKQCGGIFKVTYEKDLQTNKVTIHALKKTVNIVNKQKEEDELDSSQDLQSK